MKTMVLQEAQRLGRTAFGRAWMLGQQRQVASREKRGKRLLLCQSIVADGGGQAGRRQNK
jgi:hypothetical protein